MSVVKKTIDELKKSEIYLTVKEAKDLSQKCQSYCKVMFFGQVFRTTVFGESTNPTWNESSDFHMKTFTKDEVETENLEFEVYNKPGDMLIGSFSMKFKELEEEKDYEARLEKGGSISFKFKLQPRIEKEETQTSQRKDTFLKNLQRKGSVKVDKKSSPLTLSKNSDFFNHLKFLDEIDSLVLNLTVLSVKNLAKPLDLYCKVTFNKEELTTEVIKKSQNPFWNERFGFSLRNLSAQDYLKSLIKLEILDLSHQVVGFYQFKIADLEFNEHEDFSEKLSNDAVIDFRTKLLKKKQIPVHDQLKFLDNLDKTELIVNLKSAKGLEQEMETYCLVRFNNESCETHEVKSKDPKWNTQLTFSLSRLSFDQYFKEKVYIQLIDTQANVIGSYSIPISEVEYENEEDMDEVLNTTNSSNKSRVLLDFQIKVHPRQVVVAQPLQKSKKVNVMDQFKFLDDLEKLVLYINVKKIEGVTQIGDYQARVYLHGQCRCTRVLSKTTDLSWNDDEPFKFTLKGLQVDTDKKNYFKEFLKIGLYQGNSLIGTAQMKLADIDYNIIEKFEEKIENTSNTVYFETLIHE